VDQARMRNVQWLSVANNYFFPISENGLVLPRLLVPLMGGVPREDLIAKAVPQIAYSLQLFEDRLTQARFFGGEDVMLCDLCLYPMIKAVHLTPEGRQIINQKPRIMRWLKALEIRDSVNSTKWPRE
jgi:glutathione S-transferase